MAQTVRFATMEKFKAGELQLLVCSDVAARGLDIGGLSHVFNFDVPHHAEDYVHRIGRTGRAGLEGHAFTIAMPDDRFKVEAIEKLTGHPIPPMNVEGLDPVDWAERTKRRSRRRRSRPGSDGRKLAGAREGTGARKEPAPRKPRQRKRPPAGQAARVLRRVRATGLSPLIAGTAPGTSPRRDEDLGPRGRFLATKCRPSCCCAATGVRRRRTGRATHERRAGPPQEPLHRPFSGTMRCGSISIDRGRARDP